MRNLKLETEMPTKDDVVLFSKANHIWVNAFDCINPTDELCKNIGAIVLNMLGSRDNLLPSYLDLDGMENESTINAMKELSKLTPTLYMSINKS